MPESILRRHWSAMQLKIARELWSRRGRSGLVLISMALGLVGFGSVATTYTLVSETVDTGFLASNPPSATLIADPLSPAAVERIRRWPEIEEVDLRGSFRGRLLVRGERYPLMLFVSEDLAESGIGVVERERGRWPPPAGSVAVERSSLPFANVEVGEKVMIELDPGTQRPIEVGGIVHDVGLAPGWMEHVVYAFGSPEILGPDATLDELRFVAADSGAAEAEIRALAGRVATALEKEGSTVREVQVSPPGEHVHARQMDSLLFIQGSMALLALALSGFLVVTFVSALMADQVREIAVMKAVGGSSVRIAGLYLAMMAMLGALASVLAVPVSTALGRAWAEFTTGLLNFDIDGVAVPVWVLIVQVGVGLILPVATAAVPVWRGVRITVAEGLRDEGMGEPESLFPRWVDSLCRILAKGSRPLLISLRNTARRPGRTVLTLATLVIGGAIFVGALSVRDSIGRTVERMYESMDYDLTVTLRESGSVQRLEEAVTGLPGVTRVETGFRSRASLARDDGTRGDSFSLIAIAPSSRLVDFPVSRGRWLEPGDENAVVVNAVWMAEHGISVGESATFWIDGRRISMKIVGEVESTPVRGVVYAPPGVLSSLGENVGRVPTALIRVDSTDEELAHRVQRFDLSERENSAGRGGPEQTRDDLLGPGRVLEILPFFLESRLYESGFPVSSVQGVAQARAAMEDHLLMVADFLLAMSLLVMSVAGVGLASTMGLAVRERTRELGVLRAVGASHRFIVLIVLGEGLIFGVSSWAMALLASVPAGRVLGAGFGRIMFRIPVPVRPVPEAVGLWLLAVLTISGLACIWPARRAVRITTAEALTSS